MIHLVLGSELAVVTDLSDIFAMSCQVYLADCELMLFLPPAVNERTGGEDHNQADESHEYFCPMDILPRPLFLRGSCHRSDMPGLATSELGLSFLSLIL